MTEDKVLLYTVRRFSAAHYLPEYKGKCANLHGHTWKVEVWINGVIDHKTGMVVDFKGIKDIIDEFDHAYLNDILLNPTAENIAVMIRDIILEDMTCRRATGYPIRVRLWESGDSYVEVSGG